MKGHILCFLIAGFINPGFGHAQQIEKKKTIAVLEFQSTGDITPKETTTLTNRFRGILVQTEAFRVIEREKMTEILKEQDFKLTDACVSAECAIQVGQLLGAEQMIAGDIGKIGQTYTIDLRRIDVSTGSLLQTQQKNYKGEIDGLLDAMTEIANKFAKQVLAENQKEKQHRTLWYVIGGAVVAGGTTFVLINTQGKKQSSTGIPSAGFPNNP